MIDVLDFKGLPSDLEAERIVLASCMSDQEAADLLLEGLDEGLFTTERHRLTLRAMKAVYTSGGSLDRVLVAKQAQRDGTFEAMGGLTGLLELDEGLPRIINPERYLKPLEEKRSLRHLVRVAHDGVQRAALGVESAEIIKRDLQQAIEQTPGTATRPLRGIAETIESSGGLDAFFEGQSAQGVPIVFEPLRRMLPVLGRGRVISVGGPTGGGKSTLARQIAIDSARLGFGVALISLEMSAEEVFRAKCCTLAAISSRRIQQGDLSSEERQRLAEAASELETLPIWISDEANQTVSSIQSTVKAEAKKRGIHLVIVDYLQLIQSLGKTSTRTEAVDGISRALKRMARALDVPVLSLVQWSNEGAKAAHEGQEPGLHSIRESGAIAQDSDVVVFLVPQKQQPGDTSTKRPYRLVVKKNRSGPTGAAEILFDPRRTLFEVKP